MDDIYKNIEVCNPDKKRKILIVRDETLIVRDEKLQNDINREGAKISSVSSGKIDKYEYITGKEILPSDHSRIIGQASSTYSPHGKAFEEQIKTIEDQGIKQAEALGRKMGKKIKRKETEY